MSIPKKLRRIQAGRAFVNINKPTTFKHRQYVGGKWYELGKLQFDFLLANGLEPQHSFYDIACGCLRAGVHVIPFLERGKYHGIEKHKWLVDAGVRHELASAVRVDKDPQLLVNGAFEFNRFSSPPDVAMAQSLFTHLPLRQIQDCLTRLREVAINYTTLYATFYLSETVVKNPPKQHDGKGWRYTLNQMQKVANSTGWDVEYIGDWGHPMRQKMLRYIVK